MFFYHWVYSLNVCIIVLELVFFKDCCKGLIYLTILYITVGALVVVCINACTYGF